MSEKSWMRPETAPCLEQRRYNKGSLADQLQGQGLEAGRLLAEKDSLKEAWIPGVDLFPRTIHPQRHRGFFGEFARQGEGLCGSLSFWPRQWAAARMYAGTAKGFHIHPPHIPEGEKSTAWLQKVFVDHADDPTLRLYDKEQWDMMFFVQGTCDMILVDERAAFPRRIMRLWIDGDDQRGPNNVGLIIPPGVAHALRGEGARDLIMVYGTSTTFTPEWEGRIASRIETATLPPDWQDYLGKAG
ncbi:MAG: hypothetical protein SNJ52_05350 [Verrucomicrobiia bacterium]